MSGGEETRGTVDGVRTSSDVRTIMNEKFSNVAIDLITNVDVNAGKTNGSRYSDNMRPFAVSLHYYSPKAYRWVKIV